MTLAALNQLDTPALEAALTQCCGSTTWVKLMMEQRPFTSLENMIMLADQFWSRSCQETDWLEAFDHHPEIGDVDSLAKKFASTSAWAGQEQSGVNVAGKKVLVKLAEGNKNYKEKFGHIFIVCATGKSAKEMSSLLEERLPNDPDFEIKIAMEEQAKITRIRLEKLLH